MLFFILLLAGLFVGLLSSFFGVGGGVILVPLLYFLFPSAPPTFISITSLSVILLVTLKTLSLQREGFSHYSRMDLIAIFASSVLSASVTTIYLTKVDGSLIRAIVSVFLGIYGLYLVLGKDNKPARAPVASKSIRWHGLALISGGGVAIFSALTGLGGGLVLIPLLRIVLKFDFKRISFFNNFFMCCAALGAVGTYLMMDTSNIIKPLSDSSWPIWRGVNFGVVTLVFLGSLVTGPMGKRWQSLWSEEVKSRIFGGLLLLAGVALILT